MSDERLRQLERRWQETGQVEDEARYLVERLRAGDLPPQRMLLLADLGHPAGRAAIEALPEHGITPLTEPNRPAWLGEDLALTDLGELERWARALGRWDLQALPRAGLAALRSVLPLWNLEHSMDRRVHDMLAQIQAWILSPGDPGHGEGLRRSLALANSMAGEFEQISRTLESVTATAQGALQAALSIHDLQHEEELRTAAWGAGFAVRNAARLTTDYRVRECVARELVPWALGLADPLEGASALKG